jgi:hypothetical protein
LVAGGVFPGADVVADVAALAGVADPVAEGFATPDSFSGGVFTSACTEPDAVAFTTPGTAGLSGDGFGSPSGGVGGGDLVSSGITASAQTSGVQGFGENVNFYQLAHAVSTNMAGKFREKGANLMREL